MSHGVLEGRLGSTYLIRAQESALIGGEGKSGGAGGGGYEAPCLWLPSRPPLHCIMDCWKKSMSPSDHGEGGLLIIHWRTTR